MDTVNFDQLLAEYKSATNAWVDAIRAEESLANADHSMVEMEKLDAAAQRVREAGLDAKDAGAAYHDALREKNYGF